MCQVEDMIDRLKQFMMGEIVPQCHYPERIRASPWTDEEDMIHFHTTRSKDKLETCPVVVDFLLCPKGVDPSSIVLYTIKKKEPVVKIS
jgi:hypothetical protein